MRSAELPRGAGPDGGEFDPTVAGDAGIPRRSGRLKVTLKPAAHLRRIAAIHSSLVVAQTPAAAISAAVAIYWFGFSPTDAVLWLVSHVVGFCGVAIALHRYFSHASFKTSSSIRYLLAILAMTAGQGSLIFWVSNHRRHHLFAEEREDPHSPKMVFRLVACAFRLDVLP